MMAFADDGLKMAVDSQAVGYHNKKDRINRLRGDLGPDTLAREHFEKYGMRHSTVDDMGFTDTATKCIQTGMDLGQHPFANCALLHHPLHVFP